MNNEYLELKSYLKMNYAKLYGYPLHYEDYMGDQWMYKEEIESLLEKGIYTVEGLDKEVSFDSVITNIKSFINGVKENNNFQNRYNEFNTKQDYINFAEEYINKINKYIEITNEIAKNVINNNIINKGENKTMEIKEKKNNTMWMTIPNRYLHEIEKEFINEKPFSILQF